MDVTPLYQGEIKTNEEYLSKNGITNLALQDKWSTIVEPEERMNFLNSLSEQELDEQVLSQFGGKIARGTYRQVKEIFETEYALFQRAKELTDQAIDPKTGLVNLKDMSNPFAVEANYAMKLMTMVQKNMAEGLQLAKSYLQSLREPKDTVSLSPEAVAWLSADIDNFRG